VSYRPPLPKGTIGVLVVEDETLLLMETADAFAAAGTAVFEARHADEAMIILAGRDDISVVVTDLDMPAGQVSGRQLVDTILARWPEIGVVISSGAPTGQGGLLSERIRFVHKPCRPDDLVNAAFAIVSHLTGSF